MRYIRRAGSVGEQMKRPSAAVWNAGLERRLEGWQMQRRAVGRKSECELARRRCVDGRMADIRGLLGHARWQRADGRCQRTERRA